MTISYAQRLEDILLLRALRDVEVGFYIDLGAYDPVIHSVTKLFYEKGWSGINVEPAPKSFHALCEDRKRDVNLAIAVSDRPGSVQFHEISFANMELTGLSTSSEDYAEKHVAAGFMRETRIVPTDTLAGICERHVSGPIHFLKIDIEGGEEAALRGMDFQRWRPWIVLVEATEPLTETPSHLTWDPILLQNEYDFVLFDGLNRFYVAREKDELKPFLSFTADRYVLASAVIEEERLRAEIHRLTQHG